MRGQYIRCRGGSLNLGSYGIKRTNRKLTRKSIKYRRPKHHSIVRDIGKVVTYYRHAGKNRKLFIGKRRLSALSPDSPLCIPRWVLQWNLGQATLSSQQGKPRPLESQNFSFNGIIETVNSRWYLWGTPLGKRCRNTRIKYYRRTKTSMQSSQVHNITPSLFFHPRPQKGLPPFTNRLRRSFRRKSHQGRKWPRQKRLRLIYQSTDRK